MAAKTGHSGMLNQETEGGLMGCRTAGRSAHEAPVFDRLRTRVPAAHPFHKALQIALNTTYWY